MPVFHRIVPKIAALGAVAVLAAGGAGFAAFEHVAASPSAQTGSTTTASTSSSTGSGVHRGGAARPESALQAVLTQLVNQGKISGTQQAEITSALQQYEQTHRQAPGGGPPFLFGEAQAIATALKLTPTQLQQDLRQGMSINDIAAKQQVAPSTVQSAAYNAAKSRLDAAVSSGKLTQARETKMLTSLNSRLPQLFALKAGQFSGHAGPHGRSTTSSTSTSPARP